MKPFTFRYAPLIHSVTAQTMLALTIAIVASCAQPGIADEFQVSLSGGSVITVDVVEDAFPWTKVLANGDMSKDRIKFSDVQQLVLSDSPASEQVAKIRRLLTMLASPDYLERKSAEASLSDPAVGGNFKKMIETQVKHQSFEVRYRINRILDELDTDDSEAMASEFDRVTLKDGTTMEGDSGDFVLECTYRDQPMKFARGGMRMLSVPAKQGANIATSPDVNVKTFHRFANEFYLPNQVTVDFELTPSGAEIKRNANVNDLFTPVGLKIDTEQDGYVGVSGYGFKFPEKPATGNSICVFEIIGTYPKRFKGVMEFEFCMPNQKSVPAGVNEIGLLMARVNHSRDFIVEAYNSDGQILASVESSDEPCVFAGIKSSEPIAKVRILSNPYLFRIDRGIDEDYAVDSVCFSKPVPIATNTSSTKPVVRISNGDLIKCDLLKLNQDGVDLTLENFAPIKLALENVESIQFGRSTDKVAKGKSEKPEKTWTAILADRSTILVEPGATFTSTTFPGLSFKPSELMGLRSTQNPARFPEANDFEKGKTVMVFPTCRIVSDSVLFSNQGFNWPESAEKLLQPIQIEDDETDNEDPTPQINEVDYEKTWAESIPTIWMNSPKTQTAGTGRLRLVDGQQLVLGANSSFHFVSLDESKVVVSVGGRQTEIPIDNVSSIEFPPK